MTCVRCTSGSSARIPTSISRASRCAATGCSSRSARGPSVPCYRAIQPVVRRDVAIKAIHPHLANDPEFIRRFEAEAQIVAASRAPARRPLYDYWREPGGAYLVMGSCGRNLARRSRMGSFDLERAAQMWTRSVGPRLRASPGGRPPGREAEQHPAGRGGTRTSRTSASPKTSWRPTGRNPGRSRGRCSTSLPSRSAARHSPRGPTCMRSGSSCTRRSSANTPSGMCPTWRSTSASFAIRFRRPGSCGRSFHRASTT